MSMMLHQPHVLGGDVFSKIQTGSIKIKAADRAVRLAAAAPERQGQRGCVSNLSSNR
jgi:hypothetical protein